jgi:ABC-2 type transport system ATP-binding protein
VIETRSVNEISRAPVRQDVAIRTVDLTCAFGGMVALDHLCLEVARGTIFGFLGPNGAGKTTTMRLLLGLIEPDSGHAEVLGMDPRFEGGQVRARAGTLLGDPGLYDRLSAEENLEFYGRIWHLPKSERRARTKDLLARFGLWDRRQETPEMWSSGMRRKLAVARALLHHPELVFLDEPTSGLDPLAAHELGDDLVELVSSRGVTVFLNTHDLAEAERLCQRVAIIRSGQLVATGTPEELRSRVGGRAVIIGDGFDQSVVDLLRRQPEVQFVSADRDRLTLDVAEGARLAPLVTLLTRAGAEVEEVQRTTATLEDAFAALVQERPDETDADSMGGKEESRVR